jgi:hypothetical protein
LQQEREKLLNERAAADDEAVRVASLPHRLTLQEAKAFAGWLVGWSVGGGRRDT